MIDNIIQLETDLNRVFDESLPTWPGLSPQSARIAVMMHRAGRDAGAIADRIDMPLGSVLAFLDRVNRQRSPAPASEHSAPEPLEADDAASTSDEPVDGDDEPAIARAAPEPLQRQRDTRPDVELTALQTSLIRRLRKTRISADTIARVMRLSPDQVQRIAGEIP